MLAPRVCHDPRPDLEADHRFWEALLAAAQRHCDAYGQPMWTLHGFRCMGCRLERFPNGKMRLRKGEMSQEQYDADVANYLKEHTHICKIVFEDTWGVLCERKSARSDSRK